MRLSSCYNPLLPRASSPVGPPFAPLTIPRVCWCPVALDVRADGCFVAGTWGSLMPLTEPVYRMLGVVASINRRLWLIRVNFIPLNVAVMVLLGVGTVAGFDQLNDTVGNEREAQPHTLAVLLSAGAPKQDYVTVQGKLFTDARLEWGTEGENGKLKTVEKTWAPLVDEGTGKALMVQLAKGRRNREEPEDLTLKGMLRPLPPNLHKRLESAAFKFAGVPIEPRFMLVEGEHPQDLGSGLLLAGGAGVLLLAFVVSSLWRNVVFRSEGATGNDALSVVRGTEKLLVSGRMMLNEKTHQYFVNMPAAAGTLESGAIALVSNIDASSRFMGIKTSDRSGLWTIAIVPSSVTDAETGHVFCGLKKAPAVRFRYVDALTGRRERLVVATA